MPLPLVIMPAGAAPVSWASPITVVPNATRALLADDIDPATGEIVAISTAPHPVEAAIREAFRILRGSGPSVADIGQRFVDVRKQDERAEKALRYEAEAILAPFVARKEVQIVAIDIDAEQAYAQGAVQVRWVNLLTGKAVTT